MPVPGWPDGASLTSQREHKAPTSTQATASSPRALSSPPFLPPGRPDGPTPGTLRIGADTISRDLAVAQGIPVEGHMRGMGVVSAEEGVEEAFKRCLGESPYAQLFAAKALSGSGGSTLRRRGPLVGTRVQRATAVPECRRDNEYVQIAPFTIARNLVEYLLAASVNMGDTKAGNHELRDRAHPAPLLLLSHTRVPQPHPSGIQLHPAKDPAKHCCLHPPSAIVWPAGRGLPVDRWLCGVTFYIAETAFDSLLAKIVDGASAGGGARGLRRGEVQRDVGGARAEGCDKDLDGGVQVAVGGLGVQGRQYAEEVAVTSTSLLEPRLLAMLPAAICRLDLFPPGVQHFTSSAGVSAGAIGPADTNGSPHVTAPLTEKGVELHSAGLAESGIVTNEDVVGEAMVWVVHEELSRSYL
ncbi:hypothetical protein FIBSPDRAFT_938080 [Athelia psychrophila]|uniref:Uncharacterized protein n=1 Tax=Athelia psychrophila TaxID=1759441 RepID=A0A165Z9Y7_9AGAM|nr:hypothetical protein FIBSPDRAFT_938080 [Fibularhizoctonia sp. CBS 109695]